jgi:formiminoglutamase
MSGFPSMSRHPRPFTLTQGESPLILSMPHPGTFVPDEVLEQMNDRGRELEDTDWHMRRLYAFASRLKPSIIESHISRYVIDLNRDPSGHSLYPGQATTELVPTTTFDGAPIWLTPPDMAEIRRRRMAYFNPYHTALAAEIERVKAKHGYAILYDCHSIKSVIPRLFDGVLPTLNLGTNSLNSCAVGLHSAAERAIAGSGFTWDSNGRFKGGWITRHYGGPLKGVHAIQMEIALSAYIEEESPPWSFSDEKAAPLQRTLEWLLRSVMSVAAMHKKAGA